MADKSAGSVPEKARASEIDPRILTEIGNLGFRARIVADSAAAGLHRSRARGTSVEFAEHKEYSPGDNLRHIDWRAYARFDRYYVKQFEDESNLRALAVVDASGSMGYPTAEMSDRLSKLAYATTCAGALAYVLARQGDAVGVASYTDRLQIRVPARARRGHLQEVLGMLDSLRAEGPTRLGEALDSLAEGLKRRTVVVIFSDLLDGGLDALASAARLRARKHDVLVMHVLDPDELTFPFEDSTHFESMEDDREVRIDARAIKDAYLAEMKRFLTRAEQACRSAQVEYRLVVTNESPGPVIASVLAGRSRVRSAR